MSNAQQQKLTEGVKDNLALVDTTADTLSQSSTKLSCVARTFEKSRSTLTFLEDLKAAQKNTTSLEREIRNELRELNSLKMHLSVWTFRQAVLSAQPDCVRKLIAQKCDVNGFTQEKRSAFHLIAKSRRGSEKNRMAVLRLLLLNCNHSHLSAVDKNGQRPDQIASGEVQCILKDALQIQTRFEEDGCTKGQKGDVCLLKSSPTIDQSSQLFEELCSLPVSGDSEEMPRAHLVGDSVVREVECNPYYCQYVRHAFSEQTKFVSVVDADAGFANLQDEIHTQLSFIASSIRGTGGSSSLNLLMVGITRKRPSKRNLDSAESEINLVLEDVNQSYEWFVKLKCEVFVMPYDNGRFDAAKLLPFKKCALLSKLWVIPDLPVSSAILSAACLPKLHKRNSNFVKEGDFFAFLEQELLFGNELQARNVVNFLKATKEFLFVNGYVFNSQFAHECLFSAYNMINHYHSRRRSSERPFHFSQTDIESAFKNTGHLFCKSQDVTHQDIATVAQAFGGWQKSCSGKWVIPADDAHLNVDVIRGKQPGVHYFGRSLRVGRGEKFCCIPPISFFRMKCIIAQDDALAENTRMDVRSVNIQSTVGREGPLEVFIQLGKGDQSVNFICRSCAEDRRKMKSLCKQLRRLAKKCIEEEARERPYSIENCYLVPKSLYQNIPPTVVFRGKVKDAKAQGERYVLARMHMPTGEEIIVCQLDRILYDFDPIGESRARYFLARQN
eukprot:m.1890 g.1890  ORF g.1890 m.1890 type:complete len:726 (+) comp8010_c0_seq2:346-2523(+)